ncbi:MAG TPA: hypothetical protein VNG51_00385 [Ktedonobacteraceae bacterium]|nr:hypothetical protein [Ktedonobacteraceae bacterium]
MATTTTETTTTVSEKDLDELNALLHDLKVRANEAHSRNNVIMLACYAELVKVVAPIAERLRARVEREDRAGINRKHRVLRKTLKAQFEAAAKAAPDATA